jgi:signal transduction histidine kinase
MSWVTVTWSMAAAVSLTLAGVHLLVWLRDREAVANLLFAVSAVAAAAVAMMELVLMRAQTPAEFEIILRWIHIPVATVAITIVWFVHHYLGTGRVWLAWLITSLRGLVLVLNFSPFPNATFQEIHALREVYFLGETLFAPVGEANPWRLLLHLSTGLLLIYVLDAAVAAWKLGRARQAWVLGASLPIAIVLAAVFSGLMVRGILPGPLIGLVFLIFVLAMAFELSVELIRAKQLSRELRESEERMRLAAHAAELGFWDWDIKRDEVWIDDVGKERTGTLGPGLADHERYLSLIHPDDRDRVQQALDQAIRFQQDFEADFRMVSPGGEERWISASGKVEHDAHGEALRLRGISMDITARRQFESELQKHRSALGHTQRVFALGQLSAALAHELNQPLGAILRNAEAGELFLRQDPPDLRELREIFVDIQRDDHRAAEVIDRMRALLKHRELRFEVIALSELIGQVAALFEPEMQARHAALRITVPPTLPEVRGDRVQLQQVLVNLLLNGLDALDARSNGVRQIEIGAAQAEGGLVELSVKDTGTGIEPDRLTDLFEPFVTTKSEGIGIGLAISQTIVEVHGGRIWAENNPDGGACIRFTLPVARPGAAA